MAPSRQREKGPGPWRTCVACRQRRPKEELLRLAVVAGRVTVDEIQTLPGRGAYCCREEMCRQRIVNNKKMLFRAFRMQPAELACEMQGVFGSVE